MIRWLIGGAIYLFNVATWADASPLFRIQEQPSSFLVDLDQLQTAAPDPFAKTDLKKQRYVGEDQLIEQDSILDNNFFEDERFRFYNNTQYNFAEVKEKYRHAQIDQIRMNDLSISFGYGMEFKLSRTTSAGYEYISAFPHDRGQSIRLFWKKSF